MLSKVFPKGHRREGEPTGFKDKLWSGEKIHTIRSNFPLWEKRIKEVQKGEACISVRQWEGMPYRSLQKEIRRFTKENGVGIEYIILPQELSLESFLGIYEDLDRNDGLKADDWVSWFAHAPRNKPLPIIHFTPFRYYKSNDQSNSIEFDEIKNTTT